MVFIIAIGLAVGAVMTASVLLDLVSDREHPHADTTYRITTRTPTVFAGVVGAGETRADTPKELKAALIASGVASRVVRIAPVADAVRAPGRPDREVGLRIVAADPNFPELFRVRSGGRSLSSLGERPGVWLTRPALRRLEAVQGGSLAQVQIGGRRLPVLGVIDPPGPTSHLQYDGLAPFSEAFDYSNAIMGLVHHYPALTYLQVRGDPASAARGAARAMEQVTGLETPADLTPITRLRSGGTGGLIGEPRFVVTGGALERQTGLLLAVISLGGVAVSLLLFVQTALRARVAEMGVRICLGDSPRAIYLRGLAVAGGLMAAAALPSVLLIVLTGGAVLGLLGKPDPGVTTGVAVALAFLGCGILILAASAAGLAPILMTAPIRLIQPRPGGRRLAFLAMVVGLAVLVCASGAFAFSAALFGGEVARGASLSPLDGRLFLVPTRIDRVDAVLQALARRPDVEATGILHWRPFDTNAGNMSLQLEREGRFHQATVLTGETTIFRLLGLEPAAGVLPRLTDGPGCRAAASERLAGELGFRRATDLLGRSLTLANLPDRCLVVAIVPDIRLDRLTDPVGPALHVVGSEFVTRSERSGAPSRRIFVRLRPGAPPQVALASLPRVSAAPNVSLGRLGLNAYAREGRIAALLGLGAVVMSLVFLGVCTALVLNAIEHQRREIAIRQALGAATARLVARLVAPIVLASGIGAVLSLLANLALLESWRSLGGLASQAGPGPVFAVVVASLAPVCVALTVAYISVGLVQPAETLKSAA